MSSYVDTGGLKVARPLHDLVKDEMAPGTGVESDAFWAALASIVADLGPLNRALLDKRDEMQAKIDGIQADWKTRYSEIIEEAEALIQERTKGRSYDISFIDDAKRDLDDKRPNTKWRELHDEFLTRAREFILKMDE